MFTKAILASLVSIPLASAAIIDVFVGGTGKLSYEPSSVTANVGDSIRFTFGVKNHTVTQSTLADPCSPMAGGFFSGFMPVAATQTTDLPQFWIPVKDTKPIWAYCSQTGHCKQGMVFAVNPGPAGAANSFDNFKANAVGTTTSTSTTTSGTTNSTGYNYNSGSSTTDTTSDPYNYGGSSNTVTTSAEVATTTASASPTTHTIVVGGSAGLVYTPNQITANVGDTVQFQFQVKNHTVTQSSFANPCAPLAGGFDSGFNPVSATDTTFPTYSVMVNTTQPIWAYCKQANHCTSGMVFAINVNTASANTFDAFLNNAKTGGTSSASSSATSASASASSAASLLTFTSSSTLISLVAVVASFGFGMLL